MKKLLMLLVSMIMLVWFVAPVYAKGGFDEFGYNYNSMLFNGKADGVDRVLDGKIWGDSAYANDHLVMKWSKTWNDARFNDQPWTYEAWENNEWNGAANVGSGEVWHYKIIWVGPEKWEISGIWDLKFKFGGIYEHTMKIDSYDYNTGNFSATGYYNPNKSYTWSATGNIEDKNAVLDILYTGTNSGYAVHAEGVLSSEGTIIGNWTSIGQIGTWTGSGKVLTNPGSCWRDGGERVWGEFETIMDQGMTKGEGHTWNIHANPMGYGVY